MRNFQQMHRKDGEALRKLLRQTILLTSTMRSSLFAHTLIVKQCAESVVSFSLLPYMISSRAILSRSMDADLEFMQQALDEARAAALAGEVPVGAVLVREAKIIARSGNRTIRDTDPTAHAEMVVLREAAYALGNYRLAATTLYVTIEPCSMCAGAMIQARIPRLVYGCDDPKGGAVRSCFEILSHPRLNHHVEVKPGILATNCAALIQSFFAERR
jgi:tRNA(adenine34) deaminase